MSEVSKVFPGRVLKTPYEVALREEREIDWEAAVERLLPMHKGRRRVGRPPYLTALVLNLQLLGSAHTQEGRSRSRR